MTPLVPFCVRSLLAAASVSLFLFAGCSATDTAFRSRVESYEVSLSGTADKSGSYGGFINNKFTFRDPRSRTSDNK